jgi:hypothetical protein
MISGLLERCFVFDKIANKSTKISIEPNSHPILKELSNIKEFDDRIKFAKKQGWKLLGEGSSRTAFQLNKRLIIKIAHNEKGIAQIKTEAQPISQVRCVVPVIAADAKCKWIIMRATEPLTKSEFKDMVGFGFDQFMNALFAKFNNEDDKNFPEPRDYKEIERCELFSEVAELVFKTDNLLGDLSKISSWRTLNGRPVISDFGLTKSTYSKYYSSDSSSSSSSKSIKTTEK